MNNRYIVIGIIVVIVIIYFWNEKYNKVENMGPGVFTQLAAKGPMDRYLITNANKYLYPYPYYYGVRPKRFYSRFYPYYNYYPSYPYYPYYPYIRRPYA